MIDRKSPADPGHSCTCFPLNPAPLRVQTHPGRINSPLRTLRAPVAHPSGPGAFLPLFPAQPGTAPRTNPPWANEFAPPHPSRTCCAPQADPGHSCPCFPLNLEALRAGIQPGRMNSPLRITPSFPSFPSVKKTAVPLRSASISVDQWLKKSARTCCAPRLDPTCAAGMPPLRIPPLRVAPSFPSFTSVKNCCASEISVYPC